MEESSFDIRDSPIPVTDLATGGTVLVRGPAMSGKYGLLLRLLGTLTDCAVLISTSRQVTGARSDYAEYGDPDCFGVVDCASHVQGQATEAEGLTRYASSPKNLTEIGVKFTDLVETIQEDKIEAATVGIHSLSELVMYSETEQVYQFLRVLLAECQELAWPTVAVIDDDAASKQAVTTLSEPFDAVITTRRESDVRAFQYRDDNGVSSDWTPF